MSWVTCPGLHVLDYVSWVTRPGPNRTCNKDLFGVDAGIIFGCFDFFPQTGEANGVLTSMKEGPKGFPGLKVTDFGTIPIAYPYSYPYRRP